MMTRITRPLPARTQLYSCLESLDLNNSSTSRLDFVRSVFDYYAEPDTSRRQCCFACYPRLDFAGELYGCNATFISAEGIFTYLLPLVAITLFFEEYYLKFATYYVDDTLVSLYRDAVDLQGRRPANAKRHR